MTDKEENNNKSFMIDEDNESTVDEDKEFGIDEDSEPTADEDNELQDNVIQGRRKKDSAARRTRGDKSRTMVLKKLEGGFKVFLTLLPLIIIGFLLLAVIVQITLIETTKFQEKQYWEQKDELEYDFANRMDELNDEYVAERILKILNQSDLYIYTNSLWKYTFTVNDAEIKDFDVKVKGKDGTVTVVLTEERTENTLPMQIINIGKFTRGDAQDKVERHLSVNNGPSSSSPLVDMKEEGDNYLKKYIFTIDNVKSGDKFLITISDQLGERIGLPFNEITLTVS